jgi:hypothetical protein
MILGKCKVVDAKKQNKNRFALQFGWSFKSRFSCSLDTIIDDANLLVFNRHTITYTQTLSKCFHHSKTDREIGTVQPIEIMLAQYKAQELIMPVPAKSMSIFHYHQINWIQESLPRVATVQSNIIVQTGIYMPFKSRLFFTKQPI